MSATPKEATDEMKDLFIAAWDPTGYKVIWPDVREEKPLGREPFARFTVQHANSRQATLTGTTGSRTWERNGLLTIQIFTPIGKGLQDSYTLAKVTSDAYEGVRTQSGVWFRDVGINEIGKDGEWQQVNVTAEFTYNEIR